MDSVKADREILRNFYRHMMPRAGFQEDKYEYCWEYLGSSGIYVHQAEVFGWQRVKNTDPENPTMRDATGHCVVGDTLLMRMPKERYEELQKARKALVREHKGDETQEETRMKIDERISRLVGHDVSVSFEFKDQRELSARKGT